jgi:hypothetical protein
MPRPTIVEQNYFEFKVALQQATDAGRRIEQKEKDRWKHWVRENKIQEAAFKSVASQKFDEPVAVILDDDGPWGGYYLYTPVEEVCLKWTRT